MSKYPSALEIARVQSSEADFSSFNGDVERNKNKKDGDFSRADGSQGSFGFIQKDSFYIRLFNPVGTVGDLVDGVPVLAEGTRVFIPLFAQVSQLPKNAKITTIGEELNPDKYMSYGDYVTELTSSPRVVNGFFVNFDNVNDMSETWEKTSKSTTLSGNKPIELDDLLYRNPNRFTERETNPRENFQIDVDSQTRLVLVMHAPAQGKTSKMKLSLYVEKILNLNKVL